MRGCDGHSPVLTLCDPMDYTAHGILQPNPGVRSCSLLQGIFPTQRSDPGPQTALPTEPPRKPFFFPFFNLAIKRKHTGPFDETWADLETVIQSEVHQKEKTNIVHPCIHVKSRKRTQGNLFAKQKWGHRRGEQTCIPKRGRGRGLGDWG